MGRWVRKPSQRVAAGAVEAHVEAPWVEMGDEESSEEEVEVGSSLYPGELAPKRMRDEARGQDGRSKQQQKEGTGRCWGGHSCQTP